MSNQHYMERCKQLEKKCKEAAAKILELQKFAIWMTGCGYDFTQHEYFVRHMHLLMPEVSVPRKFTPRKDKTDYSPLKEDE